MPAIQQKRFNWLPKPSAWQEMQAWRQRRQSVSENFGAASANLIANFTAAWDAQASGMAQITVNQVTTRLQAQYQQRLSSLDALQSSVDLSV